MYKFELEHYAILVRNLRICDLRNLLADCPPLDLLVRLSVAREMPAGYIFQGGGGGVPFTEQQW